MGVRISIISTHGLSLTCSCDQAVLRGRECPHLQCGVFAAGRGCARANVLSPDQSRLSAIIMCAALMTRRRTGLQMHSNCSKTSCVFFPQALLDRSSSPVFLSVKATNRLLGKQGFLLLFQ